MISRIFSLADQFRFAELSGDFNPLHVDEAVARRTLFGRPVVHGVHLALWSLDALLPECALRLSALSVSFPSPVGIGEAAACSALESGEELMRLIVESGGAAALHLTATFGPGGDVPFVAAMAPAGPSRELGPADLADAHGSETSTLDAALCADLFPRLVHILPPGQIARILALTRIVGMRCPGLHSIFAEFTLDFAAVQHAASARIDYRTAAFDPRFNRITLTLAAPDKAGRIVAFLRPKPQQQPDAAGLRAAVAPDAFRGARALVVGGSRGIGEVCAKMLAAGGAEVRLTYHRGQADADRVVRDILSIGGRAEAFPLDATAPEEEMQFPVSPEWFPTHVLYLATPPIFVGKKGVFSPELFARFCTCYVEGLATVYRVLRRIARQPVFTLFYASSVAVNEPPLAMGEYACAKAAGEALCRFLAANDRALRVRVRRLPRLPTDQTANLQGQPAANIVETVSAILGDLATEPFPDRQDTPP